MSQRDDFVTPTQTPAQTPARTPTQSLAENTQVTSPDISQAYPTPTHSLDSINESGPTQATQAQLGQVATTTPQSNSYQSSPDSGLNIRESLDGFDPGIGKDQQQTNPIQTGIQAAKSLTNKVIKEGGEDSTGVNQEAGTQPIPSAIETDSQVDQKNAEVEPSLEVEIKSEQPQQDQVATNSNQSGDLPPIAELQ